MLIARHKFRSSGFSLIELLIGIVLIGILASLAMPSFQTWVKNSQIRNAAESIANGLQRARAEAVARNTNVAFTIGTDTSWTVSVVIPATLIDSRSSNEGSLGVTRTITPSSTTTVTFDNFGGVKTINADGTVPFTTIDLTTSGGTQNLRVEILSPGSNIKMCDPNAPSTSTRAC